MESRGEKLAPDTHGIVYVNTTFNINKWDGEWEARSKNRTKMYVWKILCLEEEKEWKRKLKEEGVSVAFKMNVFI